MARIKKSFTTQSSAAEMREKLESGILGRKELQPLFSVIVWRDERLYFESKLCNGVLDINDNQLNIDLEITLFGSTVRKKLEETLDKHFGLLEAPRPTNAGTEQDTDEFTH